MSNSTQTSEKHSGTEYDLIIVGAGIVGQSLALALATSTLKIALIDSQPAPATRDLPEQHVKGHEFDRRVSALTVSSQRFFQSLPGQKDQTLWEEMASLRMCPYQQMYVWDGEGTGHISFRADDIHAPCLGHIVENNIITAVLDKNLALQEGIDLINEEKVSSITQTPRGYRVEMKSGAGLDGRLLVGADGGNSIIRQLAEFPTREWSYGHQAIVATIKTEYPHQFTAWQRFMKTGPLAVLPLFDNQEGTDQHYCSIVWSCTEAFALELMELNEADFERALAESFEQKLGTMSLQDQRVSFPLWQKHAVDYVRDNLALIGDAAHTIHPLAGQGVNLGIADAACLARVLTEALQTGEDYSSLQVLSRYQRKRKADNLGMMALMEGFKHLFASDDLAVRWLRNAGIRTLDHSGPVKQQIMKKAMGL